MYGICANQSALLANFFWKSVEVSTQETSVKVATLFYEKLLFPAGIGALAGIANCVFDIPLYLLLTFVGFEILEPKEEFAPHPDYPLESTVIWPIFEEIAFRGIVQGTVKWIAYKIFLHRTLVICSTYHLKLATLVAIFASSFAFGLLHYTNKNGWIPVFLSTTSGLLFGTLREYYGPISSITCHMAINIVADYI